MQKSEKVQQGVEAVRNALPAGFAPETGIILGTGMGALSAGLQEAVSIPYADIPAYPRSTVKSHAGRFVCGSWRGRRLVAQDGRCHLYEGYSPEEIVRGVRIMASLGVKTLLLTNAAGSLNPLFPTGSLMAITDQINFTGSSPLTGVADKPGQNRFADMSGPYDENLLRLAQKCALNMHLRLEQGVYLGLAGPQLESRAETRMFRAWGADAVGMSTVLEVIAARSLGLRVLAFSVLTNQNLPDRMAPVSLDEILEQTGQSAQSLRLLLDGVLAEMP
ncbi:MAG: purine-nucleoside phosphorylase [Deltaproteobacteria bacterium]|jgi:purine-nucleoside phosphorylase|nr:purine-nucleoside phosphorylase [Deltaproteobacteria bacterium]